METKKILELKEGNYKVFAEVFDMYWSKVYYYLLKKTKNTEESKDLTQTVFVKMWKYRDKLSAEVTLNEQIFRKTRQTFIDWLRHEHRMRSTIVSVATVGEPDAQVDPGTSSLIKPDVLQALKSLPPKRKEVFELRHIYGYSYKEIAVLLGVSIKTVDNQLTKANLQLRKLLQVSIYAAIGNELIKQLN